jgi:hypothetical protein
MAAALARRRKMSRRASLAHPPPVPAAARPSRPPHPLRAALALLPLLAAACGGRLDVPRPAASTTTAAPLPSAEPATITLPITIALAAVRAQIDSQFPPADSLDRARCEALGGLVCHQYVYRRDTLDLRMDGDRISLFTRLRYRGRVALPGLGGIGSCGYGADPMKRAELRLASTLYWRADWRLGARDTRLSADLVDPCRATVLNVDATPLMQRIVNAQLRDLRQSVDSALPTVATVRQAADSMWRALQQPLPLDSGIWLVMAPERVTLAPLAGRGGVAVTAVSLTARPRVVVGERPRAAVRPLPRLALGTGAGAIHVPVDIEIPFADIGRRAAAQLAGQTAGQGMRVSDVKVWSAGDTAVVQVDLAGKVNGALYLVGRVGYDIASRTLAIDDLRYTIQSASAMSRVKVTLGAPLVRRAVESATNGGRWNVGALLDDTRDRMTAELNRPLGEGVRLAGAIHSVRLAELRTTPSAFLLRVVLDGEARVVLE